MKNHLPTHPSAVLALAFLATVLLGMALFQLGGFGMMSSATLDPR